MTTVTIIPHPNKEIVKRIVPQIVAWFDERQVAVKLLVEDAKNLGVTERGCEKKDLFLGTDFVLVLGGDGTVLRAARLMQEKTLPVFGVNLGRIGFLMRFCEEDMYESLTKVLEGNYTIEKRAVLQVDIEFLDGARLNRVALNEALISGEEFNRLIELDVWVNDNFYSHFSLDGIIIASPTGSTAYSLSAGGPLVSPGAQVLILTPICSHSLFDRTMVLSPEDKIVILPRPKPRLDELRISLDGIIVGQSIKQVKISNSPHKFKFIVLKESSFFANIRHKLEKLDDIKKE